MRSLTKSRLIVATICAMGAASAALAQGGPPPEQTAIEARQSAFKLIAWNWGPMAGMLRGAKYDAAVVQKNTARIEAIGAMIPDLFAMDTRGKVPNVKTRALEGIWTSGPDFKAKTDDFLKAVAALSTAAKSGDEAAFKSAAGALGKTCGNCHDTYRAK